MTPEERYGAGYWTGVADEHARIREPEAGYPDDPLYLRGVAHGRADYRRRIESLLTRQEDLWELTSTPHW